MKMWNLTLTVSEDGHIHLKGMSDGIPPGEIEITGTDDGNRVVLEARQRDPQGRFVIAAFHRRDRAEETLEQTENRTSTITTGAGTELPAG